MTGWRLGWLIVVPELVRPIELLAQNLFIRRRRWPRRRPALSCHEELDQRVETYRRSRDACWSAYHAADSDRFAPLDGAFYLYADYRLHLTDDSHDLCTRILEGTGVALISSADFDGGSGHRHLRLAFAGDPTA